MEKTIENLTKAFIGESQARNRYTFYASTARKEGYEQIASIFQITADNENEHAEWFYKMLNEAIAKSGKNIDPVIVEAEAPVLWKTTAENLKAAIHGEHMENSVLYPAFAEQAQKDGFPEFAARIRAIGVSELHHEGRYKALLKHLDDGTLFRRGKKVQWMCRKCGYIHIGEEPPVKCPSCDHDRSYYQVRCETY
ncbi:MAG: Rubrerythrin [Methanocella sp. PtaU1.Bin125]|nr:MAG: Rubrerythrin [Methanocella sp. PtaU1.Bin125]